MKVKLSSGNQAQPLACLLRKAAFFGFSPRSVLAVEQGGSWLPPAPCALVLCILSVELETNPKSALPQAEGGWGLKMPCVHWHHQPKFLQLGRDPARVHLRKGTKQASGSCIRESETLLGKPSSAPKRVCSGKQHFLVSPLGLSLP